MAATHSPCPGSGERQRWRGGKGHDGHTGMIYNRGSMCMTLHGKNFINGAEYTTPKE